MILVTKTSDQARQRGHTLSTFTILTSAQVSCAPPPATLLLSIIGCLGWQLLNQPSLFYIVFSFHPCLPRFPHGVYNYFAISCAFSPLFRPPRSYSRSRSRSPSPFPSPLLSSLPSPFPSPFPSGVRLRVPTPVPVPVPVPVLRSFVHFHPRSRFCSIPVPMTVHVPVTVSVPTPDSNPAPDPVRSFLSLGPGYPPGTMRLYRRRALRMGPSGARKRHPLSAEMVTRAE